MSVAPRDSDVPPSSPLMARLEAAAHSHFDNVEARIDRLEKPSLPPSTSAPAGCIQKAAGAGTLLAKR
jgi:hypothetical protein